MSSPPIARQISGHLTRRRALAGAAGTGLALPVLAACGGDDAGETADDPTSTSAAPSETATSEASPTTGEPSASESTAGPDSEPAADGVVATGDVPVGSGVILAEEQVVVTQPTEGDIKVFTSICTHQGCRVTEVTDVISCPCHGSAFDIATGDVVGGPAPAPLAAIDFAVEGDQVVLS